jgi:hypothetical protein
MVPRVPILRQATAHPGLQASYYTTNLALRLLGARHDWASSGVLVVIDKFTKWIKVKPVTSPKCRAYTPGPQARKGEDRLVLEFPCNPTMTRVV